MNGIAHQLLTLVRSARKKAGARRPRFLGVRYDAEEALPEAIDVDGERWRVLRARSPLEARIALVDVGDDGPALLVLPRKVQSLGLEVDARLAGRKPQDIEPWALVRGEFQARRLDRRVVKLGTWVASELLAGAPPGGYSPAPSGLLDLDTVWGALFPRLGISGARPSIADVLAASALGGVAARWRSASEEFRAAAARRLRECAGVAGALAAATIEKGHGDELVPIGLVLDLALAGELAGDSRTLLLRGRLERFGLHIDEPETARPWAVEALSWVRTHLEGNGEVRTAAAAVLERAEALLDELRARELAGASRALRSGLELRTARLAGALAPAGAGAFDRVAAEGAHERFQEHLLVALDPALAERRERARNALRLARWLASESREPSSLAEHAERYRACGAYVDRARLAIARGEGDLELGTVYSALVDRATTRREAENAAFARRLARWLDGGEGAGDVLPIEDVLPRLVAPLARSIPVLLVVMDGMSEAIAEELAEELQRGARFQRMSPDAQARLPAVIGLLPSTTEVCRTSLLCGAPRVGGQAEELEGFEELAARFEWRGRATQQRILFHQGELTGRHDKLSGDVVRAIESKVRVVGVVVNAVDEQLKGARQLQPGWTLRELPVLQELVHAAEMTGRALVLTSDHGHVVDAGRTRMLRSLGENGRWRPAGGELDKGELEVLGGRVLRPKAGGPCVLLWSEGLRYSNPHAGYHGGASPQEVVTPLFVLVPQAHCQAVQGWSAEVHSRPWWWDGGEETDEAGPRVRLVPTAPAPLPVRKPSRKGDATPPMFPDLEPTTTASLGQPAWIDRLFTTEMWSSQRRIAGRTPPPERDVADVLAALVEANGKLSMEALKNRTRFTSPRLRGLLTAMGRILNVDGYAVLEVEIGEGTVTLSQKLLFTQFGLEEARA